MAPKSEQARIRCGNATEGYASHPFGPDDGLEKLNVLKSCTVCDSKCRDMHCHICGTWYCSRECRINDWLLHKDLCEGLSSTGKFNKSQTPKNNVRAILFPVDSDKPVWVWIDLKTFDISIVRALGIKGKGPLKKPANKIVIEDINKSLRHRVIGHGIRQFTVPGARDTHGVNTINTSIFKLAQPGSLKSYFVAAIFFAFCTREVKGVTQVYYESASPRDLRMIIEWYYTRPENPFVSVVHRLPIKSYGTRGDLQTLQHGLKLNCSGEINRTVRVTGKPFLKDEVWENVKVLSENLLGQRRPCDLAQLVGLRWVVQQLDSLYNPIVDGNRIPDYLHNWHGSILLWKLNNDFPLDWSVPRRSSNPTPFTRCGSVLITHERGHKINRLHIVCFIRFVYGVITAMNTKGEYYKRLLDGEKPGKNEEIEELEKLEELGEVGEVGELWDLGKVEEDEEGEEGEEVEEVEKILEEVEKILEGEATEATNKDMYQELIAQRFARWMTRENFEDFWKNWAKKKSVRLSPFMISPYNDKSSVVINQAVTTTID